MAVKVWLKDRWDMLFPLLQDLTVEQEVEIARLCQEEIEAWRAREGMSESSLRVPMTATRKEIKSWPLTEANSWLNPRKQKKEHIVLKYMNFSVEQWAAMAAPSAKKLEARLEDVKFVDDPDAVVAKAVELLASEHWYDVAVALAVLTGRRYEELVTVGELFRKTLYTVTFKGQLKRKDKVLPPYEIPILVSENLVFGAWERLRSLTIGFDGRLVSEAAQRHFSDLVPARSGGDLYTHLFRAVYGCIAVYYFAPPETLALKYLARIYGHYWVLESSGQQQYDYAATLHYSDYAIGDRAILASGGRRQGIKLGDPGVEVLEKFKQIETGDTKEMTETVEEMTEKASKTGYSMYKPRQDTKDRLDQIAVEEHIVSSSKQDDVLRLLVNEHYQLRQLRKLDVNLDDLISLLADAAEDNNDPVAYLSSVLAGKRQFKQSYEKRHQGKDYSSMSLSELRDTKTTEAAHERFGRAVAAIMAYNDAAAIPDVRWYINAAVVTDLVGGKPALAAEFLALRKEDLDAHHTKYALTSGYNRRPISIVYRVAVPELPGEEANLEEQIRKHEEQEAKRKARKAGAQEV